SFRDFCQQHHCGLQEKQSRAHQREIAESACRRVAETDSLGGKGPLPAVGSGPWCVWTLLLARALHPAHSGDNTVMDFHRSSGVLLHISSLPSYGGIGDLGPAAYEFVEFLA